MVLKKKKLKLPAEDKDFRKALLNILEDVEEERQRAEEEKEKTLSIITNFSDGLLVFDKENKFSLINPKAEKFFNIKSGEIIGKLFSELAAFPQIAPVIFLIGKEIAEIFRQEVKIKEDLILEVSVIPITSNEKTSALVVLHDVTREKEIEKMKTEFVSLAAHQLRTPLSAIKWALKMLVEGDLGQLLPEQMEIVKKTYQSNERMVGLVNDLLDVTRIEEGKYLFKPVFTEIEPIVRFVINSYQEEAKRKELILEIQKPVGDKMPRVMIDVEKMKIAIQNLIDNAVKYTLPGGRVTVSFKYDKKELAVAIKDTGVGIPEDQKERVFSKFFRGTNVVKMETDGSGLGLFIAKNIIEAHGGKIWFESERAKGTTFYFSLPVREEFAEFLKEF